MKTVIGKLVNVSGRFWFFVTDSGEELRLYFEGDDRPPVETKIALVISDEPEYEDGGYLCLAKDKYWTPISSDVVAATNPYVKRIAVYWQKWPGRDQEEEMAEAREWALELECFYKMYSRKQWEVEAKAFWWDGTCNPDPPNYCALAIGQEVDVGDFDPTYHHVVSIYSNSSYCGLGNISGNRSATYRYGSTCNEHTVIHELGHNFGLHHANADDGGEYRDKSCVMGMGPHTPGLNSPHLLELHLETERERIDVNRSIQLLICPIELMHHAMHDNEWQHVVLEKDGNTKYYLSLRKDKGWPYNPGKYGENILFLHYRKDGKTWLHSTYTPSETVKRLPNGVKMTYHEYANETARVTLDYEDGIEVTPVVMPTGFPEVFTGSELGPQHAGLWYDPDLSGQGFDLAVSDGRMVIYWYTYDLKGFLRFYWGVANLGDGSEEFTLYTTQNGTFADPTIAEVLEVGQGQIYFTGAESGVFNYRTTEHGRGSVEIKPVALSQDQRSGLWYDKAKNKSGFSVQFFPHLNKAILYWYNYGEKTSYGTPKQIETQRWWMCDCEKVTDSNYTATIYQMEGGIFGKPNKPKPRVVGNGTLSVDTLNSMRFAYAIAADDSTTGQDTLDLTRLF